ncbi:MAG: porin [Burkholderiaceae bacterium]|nr:porin [Burkholderiaceae bacterium]
MARIARIAAAAGACGLAVLAWPAQAQAPAQAGSSVTLFGIIDSGVEHLRDVGPQKLTITRVPTQTGTVASRVGLRGSEDLGGGLRALFTIENGFAPDMGSATQGGRLFGRQAWVGVSGAWGTLSLGRQYTMLFWSLLDADLLGPNMYSSGSLDAYIPNARADNAIAYRGTFGPTTLGATWSFGRDAVNAGPSPGGTNCAGERAGNARECRGWSALVKVDLSRGGVALAVDEIRGGPGAFAGLTSADRVDRRISANGFLRWGATRVAAGLVRRNNDGAPTRPKSDLWYAGATHPLGAQVTVEGQAYRLDYDASADAATLFAARVQYAFSRRTSAYATAGWIDNDGTLDLSVSGGAPGGNPVAGGTQKGVMVGVRHVF